MVTLLTTKGNAVHATAARATDMGRVPRGGLGTGCGIAVAPVQRFPSK